MFFRQGSTIMARISGIETRSGSCGPCPTSPAAKPAKPAPSVTMSSRAVAGTSLALGTPLISTKEQRKYSIPFCWTSVLKSSVNSVPPLLNLLGNSGRGFFSQQPAAGEAVGRKRLHQGRGFAGGNCFGQALAGYRAGLEAPCAPADIHKEIVQFAGRSHDRSIIRAHVTDSGPLAKNF